MRGTLDQQRAAFALDHVDRVKTRDDAAKYKTQLLKLPARLHTSGLGQTVAFYLASGSDSPEATICGWLQDWLGRDVYSQLGGSDDKRLIDWVTGNHSRLRDGTADAELLYRQASREVRALAVWLKRFAEAFIEGERSE